MQVVKRSRALDGVIINLGNLFTVSNVDTGHGIGHALAVLDHASNALEEFDIDENQILSVKLAALLHDADDRKFFKDTQNARDLLQDFPESVRDDAMLMIDLVSCSKNGNARGDYPLWMLIPRFADRLEALGIIGIVRCYEYSVHTGRPMFTSDTPKCFSREDIQAVATAERFNKYVVCKESISMIDHFYDKLLHLKLQTGVKYIDDCMETRHEQLVEFVLKFWKHNGTIDMANYINDHLQV